MLVPLTYYSKTAEVCSTDKNKRSYDFTVCLPFWNSLTGSQQQMLRLNTIVRSYRAGDDVIFSMPEKNGLFLCKCAKIETDRVKRIFHFDILRFLTKGVSYYQSKGAYP